MKPTRTTARVLVPPELEFGDRVVVKPTAGSCLWTCSSNFLDSAQIEYWGVLNMCFGNFGRAQIAEVMVEVIRYQKPIKTIHTCNWDSKLYNLRVTDQKSSFWATFLLYLLKCHDCNLLRSLSIYQESNFTIQNLDTHLQQMIDCGSKLCKQYNHPTPLEKNIVLHSSLWKLKKMSANICIFLSPMQDDCPWLMRW